MGNDTNANKKTREQQLKEYAGDDRLISSMEMYCELMSQQQSIQLTTGFPSLDIAIGGIQGGEVIIISGWTGNGKTTFAQTITYNLNQINKVSTWFSYEVRALNFLEKFGKKIPNFLMPAKLREHSLNWIFTRIEEGIIKFNSRVVFIDHLHYLINLNERANMSLQIGDIMRKLKRFALNKNIVIFLIAHPAKTMNANKSRDMNIGDIRDSSFIEQEADTVLYIWRTFNNPQIPSLAKLKIAKNRKTGILDTIFLFKQDNYLYEIKP